MLKTQPRAFLAHVTALSACESEDGADMVLVDCQGASGSVSWLCGTGEEPAVGTVVRATVEVIA